MTKKFINTASKFFLCVFVAIAVLSFALYSITKYETLSPIVIGAAEKQITENLSQQDLQNSYAELSQECSGKQTVDVSLSQNTEEKTTIDCNQVRSGGPADVGKIFATALFKEAYYWQYSCSFMSCFGQPGAQNTFLLPFSDFANKNYYQFFWISAIVSLIVAALVAVSSKSPADGLKGIGACLVIDGSAYIFLILTGNSIGSGSSIVPVELIIGMIAKKFLPVLIAGVVLFAAGFFIGLMEKKETEPEA